MGWLQRLLDRFKGNPAPNRIGGEGTISKDKPSNYGSVDDEDVKHDRHVTYGQATDVGLVRGSNQDALFTMLVSLESVEEQPDFGLFIVADGMGGHHHGEMASALAVKVVARYVIRNIYLPLLDEPEIGSGRPTVGEALAEAIQVANEEVSEKVPDGGTTVTAAALLGDVIYIAHVGDSRAYLVTDDGLEQLTRDHSLVQRLVELKQLTPEEAAEHPQRNVLYKAVGQSDDLDIDAITLQMQPGAKLMLCSDGLWNVVSSDMIHKVIMESPSPQVACEQLVSIANTQGGGPDNITVVVAQMPS